MTVPSKNVEISNQQFEEAYGSRSTHCPTQTTQDQILSQENMVWKVRFGLLRAACVWNADGAG